LDLHGSMQLVVKAFLAFFLAHLLIDLLPQPVRWVKLRSSQSLRGFLPCLGAWYVGAVMLGTLAEPSWFWARSFHFAVLALGLARGIIDRTVRSLTRAGKLSETVWSFLGLQGLYATTICGAAILLVRPPWEDILPWRSWISSHAGTILLVSVVYVGVIFGGGHLIRLATKGLLPGNTGVPGESCGQLKNAGMYIGWLERFLVLTVLLLESPTAVGLILTAKSVVRYPEFKSLRFAEYFLIGTLLSISLAVVGGIVLAKALQWRSAAGP
jgi:hypothetical protein